jgi:murein DD-endopeptidase MepM/ murein hydrolase activator NlpD
METGATRLTFREPRRTRRWPLLLSVLVLGALGLGFATYLEPPAPVVNPSAVIPADDTARPVAERTRTETAVFPIIVRSAETVPEAPQPVAETAPDAPQPAVVAMLHTLPDEHDAPAAHETVDQVVLPETGTESAPEVAPGAEVTLQDETEAALRQHEPALQDQAAVVSLDTPTPAEALPAGPEPGPDGLIWKEHVVAPGDSLSRIFSQLAIFSQLNAVLALGPEARDLQRIHPGERLRAGTRDGQLETLIYEPRGDHYLKITRNGATGAFVVEREDHELETDRRVAHAEIQQSLFLDGSRAGLSDAMLIQIADIFGWDIDFAWDIHPGDRIIVVYDRIYKDGEYLRDGPVLAAEFQNQGRTLRALRFAPDGADAEYFTPEGESLRQAFIRTPVDVGRISSHFGPRKHPLLGYNRQHQGVDYAAPTGTPIRAAGNGRIVHRGTRGGYGKTVIIDHGNNYKTLYAHMNDYRSGQSVGSRVRQGEIIGYVGMTGLATGPHLHYEFHQRDKPVNPVTVALPRANSLPRQHIGDFRSATAPLLAAIDTMRETQLAAGSGTR